MYLVIQFFPGHGLERKLSQYDDQSADAAYFKLSDCSMGEDQRSEVQIPFWEIFQKLCSFKKLRISN